MFQNVVLNSAIVDASLQKVVFLEDCVAAVSQTGHFFVSVIYLTSNPQRVRGGTHLGTMEPVSLVYRDVPQQLAGTNPKTDVDKDRVDFVCKVCVTMNLSTDSQFTSSSEIEICPLPIHTEKVFRTPKKKEAYRPPANGSYTRARVSAPGSEGSVGL